MLEPIDHSVSADDQFAKVPASVLGNDATDFWEWDNRIKRSEEALNNQRGIVFRVASYVSPDRFEILDSLLSPPNGCHPSKRRFTSSWLTRLPAFA